VAELTQVEMEALLDEQRYGRLGCLDDEGVYVLPMIYARQGDALYVLTSEGRKIRAMRQNPRVCFEVDEYDAATGNWRCVILQGRYQELPAEETAGAIELLSGRFGKRRQAREGVAEKPPLAFRIRIESMTGRSVQRVSPSATA
jgi:nitroimidazol reductase NimA-like FMN-containing flavoprotein (pyridoxamine 5'-phosphate oxidase superfamily)